MPTPPFASTLLGHERVRKTLGHLVERNRVPAAVLFAGPPGVGKRTLAEALATALLETSVEISVHPDVLRISLREDTALRKALGMLLQRVSERPLASSRRIVLLLDVDRFSPSSASLLLKSIEDAPRFAVFLLTATHRDRVAPTIRSRALLQELHPLPLRTLSTALISLGVSPSEADECALLSGGRPGLALKLADDPALLLRYKAWLTVFRARGASWREKSAFAAEFDDEESATRFIEFLQGHLRTSPWPLKLLRRAREATAMLRQHVPPPLVVEYVLGALP